MASLGDSSSQVGTRSLQAMAHNSLMHLLCQSIWEQGASTNFAVGGSIPIVHSGIDSSPSGSLNHTSKPDLIKVDEPHQHAGATVNAMEGLGSSGDASLPITLRWDSSVEDGLISKLVFPIEASASADLEQLVKDCQPASFGYKGKDVYDETYRKASKLETSAFSTTFSPYELGIIDAIAQVLLPSAKSAGKLRGVRAELYKLNIYSGPSGKFQAHVDTPRSKSQFGSLVVCLPCDYEGGQFVIRHEGNDMTFDWSTSGSGESGAASVKWAAFYSDCEHEVLEVKSGHRITLTYNLYVSRGSSDLAGHCPWVDPKQLPLYKTLHAMLEVPSFMKTGGLLGICCSHSYAHANREAIKYLPSCLKGVDMIMYEVFCALGLEVSLRPVLNTEDEDRYGSNEFDVVGEELCEMIITDSSTEHAQIEEICEEWGSREDIYWLKRKKHEVLALAYLTYGNQAGIGVMYSAAAMVVEILPFSKRN